MEKDTGGYAFPIPNADFQTFQPKTFDEYKRIQSGMTLRDYFAAKAMQVLLNKENLEGYGVVSEHAYLVADRMIEAMGQ